MLESELAAAAAGGVTSLVCPPDTDPVLDEPGPGRHAQVPRPQVEPLPRLFPLGALTRGLAGEVLTEMAELTEAGCVGFSQADVAVADTQVLHARAAIRRHLRLHGLAAAAGRRGWARAWRPGRGGDAAGPVRACR